MNVTAAYTSARSREILPSDEAAAPNRRLAQAPAERGRIDQLSPKKNVEGGETVERNKEVSEIQCTPRICTDNLPEEKALAVNEQMEQHRNQQVNWEQERTLQNHQGEGIDMVSKKHVECPLPLNHVGGDFTDIPPPPASNRQQQRELLVQQSEETSNPTFNAIASRLREMRDNLKYEVRSRAAPRNFLGKCSQYRRCLDSSCYRLVLTLACVRLVDNGMIMIYIAVCMCACLRVAECATVSKV